MSSISPFEFNFRDPIASFVLGHDAYIDIKPSQVYYEVLRLAGVVADLKPRRVLEIDIVSGPPRVLVACRGFGMRLKKEYKHKEIVKDWNQGGYDVGVPFL